MHHVYILLCGDGSLYTGRTGNVERRLRRHREGTGARYTALRPPLRLVYLETHPTRHDAQDREARIKGWSREKKRALMRGQLLSR